MLYTPKHKTIGIITAALSLALFLVLQSAQASMGATSLAAKIAQLGLGMEGYTIGTTLSAEKKEFSTTHLLDDAYEGTYKFRDGDLVVVVSKQADTIIAIYQRYDSADFEQTKTMVSGLMGLYGDPTAMAHDKLIYWAYNEEGKISEDTFNLSRGEDKTLDVLATVKFSSDFPITSDEKTDEQKGTIYFIISSDRLTEEFMQNK